MTHTSVTKLTDCPSNLKEAVDWILRVTGKDGVDTSAANSNIKALAREVCKLLGLLKGAILPDISGIIGEIEVDDVRGYGPISTLAEALRVFTGYDRGSRGTIEETGIAMRPKNNSERPYDGLEEWKKNNYAGYFFSYPREATWLRDVQHAGLMDGQKKAGEIYALILLGSMPILYYGLAYLYWRSHDEAHGLWMDKRFDGSDEDSTLGKEGALSKFMQAMGYKRTSLSNSKCGNVMKKVANSLQDLKVSTYGGYSAYLNQLEKNARPNIKAHAYSYPLYGLYFVACAYLKFQYQSNNNIVCIKIMKNTLNNLGSSSSYDDFKERIQAFPSQVKGGVASGFSEPGSDGPRKSGSSGTSTASFRTSGPTGSGSGSTHHPVSPDQESENVSGTAADTISSSVGYVAGGIVGTAAVGIGVALATNVNGVTTLIKDAIGMV
ncbi:variant erythrocyte surface antigen-1 family protein [Babesia caballi]|uniref:Variant erythrocyte surface antigen-1 family protein n=1 Tax=Babesia caballi TaxID=5871 RepID=A0AAV4LPN6_BABCB|nr:variant erythrocyte surface antigen-1 family protein [Babesia caballi]